MTSNNYYGFAHGGNTYGCVSSVNFPLHLSIIMIPFCANFSFHPFSVFHSLFTLCFFTLSYYSSLFFCLLYLLQLWIYKCTECRSTWIWTWSSCIFLHRYTTSIILWSRLRNYRGNCGYQLWLCSTSSWRKPLYLSIFASSSLSFLITNNNPDNLISRSLCYFLF